MSDNHYQVLGIPRDADEREIKRAYHRLARELHPDKAETPEKARESEQKFALVSTAYNLLKDPDQRREYDRRTFGAQAPAPSAGPTSPTTPTASVINPPRPTVSQSPSASSPSLTSSPALSMADMEAKRVAIAQKAYVKGLQLMKEKEYAKAAEFFEAAIGNCGTEANYHAKLAMALIEAKKSATRAIEAAQKAIELDRYNLDYKFTLAQIYGAIGSKSNAVRIYEEILRWDKDNPVANQMLREMTKKGGLMGKLGESGGFLGSLFKKKPS